MRDILKWGLDRQRANRRVALSISVVEFGRCRLYVQAWAWWWSAWLRVGPTVRPHPNAGKARPS